MAKSVYKKRPYKKRVYKKRPVSNYTKARKAWGQARRFQKNVVDKRPPRAPRIGPGSAITANQLSTQLQTILAEARGSK